MFTDFKSSGTMFALAIIVVAFICVQSLFFLKKAYSRGKELGITTEKLKNTITSSALFSIAPALGIAVTVLALATTLGYVLPWIRLTVIGSISYETVAAEAALKAADVTSINNEAVFSAVAWVMTLGSLLPIILVPLLAKKIQKTVTGAVSKNNKWVDVISAAAFIGIIAAFLSSGITGVGSSKENIVADGSGVLSVTAIVTSIIFMLTFSLINKKYKKNWIDALALPVSMVLAIVIVVAICIFAPEVAQIEWRY